MTRAFSRSLNFLIAVFASLSVFQSMGGRTVFPFHGKIVTLEFVVTLEFNKNAFFSVVSTSYQIFVVQCCYSNTPEMNTYLSPLT